MRSDYLYKILIIDDDVCDRERESESVLSLLSVCLASVGLLLGQLRGDFDVVQLWPGDLQDNNKLDQASHHTGTGDGE